MVNYKNGKIYKLVNDELNLTYYGSTCGKLRARLCAHKSQAKNQSIWKCTSKLLFEQGICKIFLVEEYPTDNKMLLLQRERFYIENFECVNKRLPSRTIKEWYVDNREQISKKKQIYYVDNKDQILKQQKEWYVDNREQILKQQKDYDNANKEQKKIYQLQNADKIKEKQKLYYQKNADKIKEQQKMYAIKNKDKINQKQKIRYAKKKLEQSLKLN
jgi:hypothetical protein